MTASTTTRLALYKTSSDGSDLVNVVTDLLNNLDAIDLNIGYRDCTSTTRPSTVWKGLPIRESDTGRLYVSNGTAPASASWKQIPAEGASFLAAFTYAGAVSLNSTLTVTGATSLGSTLAVTGGVTLSSNLSVAGSGAVTGNQSVGGNLTVAGVRQLQFVRKTADEPLTSNTTMQNDDHLVVSVAANGIYTFELMLMAQTANSDLSGDIKVAFTFPTGGTLHFTGTGPNNADLSSTNSSNSNGEWVARNNAVSGTTFIPYGMSGVPIGILLKGILINGSTAGSLQLQWAQNASNANALTVLTGSWMQAERVA